MVDVGEIVRQGRNDILAGSLAGSTCKLFEYPLDTIKVQMQTSKGGSSLSKLSPLGVLKLNMKEGGVRRLYQGIASPLDPARDLSPLEIATGLAIALALWICAMLCSTLWHGREILSGDFRRARLGAQSAILLLQTFAEFWSCWGAGPLLRHAVLAIFALKVAMPMYFIVVATTFAERAASTNGSSDGAAGKGNGKTRGWRERVVAKGIWEHHENFHVGAAVAHASQLWLVLAAAAALTED
jgi:hypothetical protein